MFGSLFEEDENSEVVYQAGRNGKTSENGKQVILTAPPPPRPYTNMCGIQNQGATCYLNSLLQTLLFTPEFRDGLFALSREELGWVDSSNDKPANKKLRIIPVELQKLFSQLLLADVEAVSTADLTDSFGWVENEELQQHDVQELNRILFSAIEKSLVGTSGMDLISRLYRGTVVNQVECLECGHISEREEGFFDLTISVSGHTALESSLKSTFLIPEKMDGNNRYHCSRCDQLVDANKGAKLRRLPPVLTLSLLRFSYNPMKGERFKDTSKFSFPTRLDLSPFRDNSGGAEKEKGDCLKSSDVYQLFSIVVHKGNAHGGHYHAYVRDVGCLGRWNHSSSEEKTNGVCENGEKESAAQPEDLQKENEVKPAENDDNDLPVPAALLRDILRQGNCIAPSDTMPLVDLCSKLSELTCGSSWRETFQQEFGRLSRFLTLHPSVFYFNKVTRAVGLQPPGVKALVPPRAHRESYGSSADGGGYKGMHRRKKRKKKKGRVGRKRKGMGDGKRVSAGTRRNCEMGLNDEDDEEEGESDDCDGDSLSENGEAVVEGCHWFDFDDASVTAIPASALEAQFSGRESAYMLFYRREGLGSRKGVKGKKEALVPEHLAKLVEERNLQLKKERKEYEKALHEIFVRVLPSSAYIVRNGGLQKRQSPGNEILEEIRVSADKRWTIERLNQEILKVCEGWKKEGKCGWDALYTCQDTPCGLHLVKPLLQKPHPDMRLVKDVVNEDNFRIFAWNGVEVGDIPYHAGPENEPLLLRILLPPVGGVCHEITRGFPKSCPLSRIRVLIAELCRLPLLTLYLSYEPPPEPKPPHMYHLRRGAVGSQENFTRPGKCIPKTFNQAQKNGGGDGDFTLVKPIRLSLMSNAHSIADLGLASGGRILVNTKSISGNASPEGHSSLVVWVEDWSQTGVKANAKRTISNCNNSNFTKENGHAVVQWGIEGRVVRIEVPIEMTVSQLKKIAIKQLELPPDNYRLRKQEDESINGSNDSILNGKIGLKCPLQEHLVLNEANIRSGSKVILEEGQPVEDKQVWLTFSPPPRVGNSPRELEIIVDKKCSVRELLRNMVSLAHLSGEEWHIRKTKWNGDPGEPLDDLSASVSEELLSHGQHLNLCEKSLPHRGFIRLHLFLCSNPKDSNKLIQSSSIPAVQSVEQNGGVEQPSLKNETLKNGYIGDQNTTLNRGKWIMEQLEKPPCLEMTYHTLDDLGCLEVDQELSLDQLKETIIALCPTISSLCLPSPRLLRLRLLRNVENTSKVQCNAPERTRLSRVLRNNWTHCTPKNANPEKTSESNPPTLSSLQVHAGATLGVQVLLAEEELGPHGVVLELCQSIPGGKGYFPPVELIWNNSSHIAPEKCRNLFSSETSNSPNNVDTISPNDTGGIPMKPDCKSSETPLSCSTPPTPIPQTSSNQSSQEEADSFSNEINPLFNFKKAVSSKLGLSQDSIILAKYLSAKRDWMVFQDATSYDKSMARPRKKGGTENSYCVKSTRHCLANLSDGDIIGVKDMTCLAEGEEAEDFSLLDESVTKQSNGKSDIIGDKGNNGLSNGQGENVQAETTDWNETPKKCERGIHIRVVDYS